jgi:hypothetical protein
VSVGHRRRMLGDSGVRWSALTSRDRCPSRPASQRRAPPAHGDVLRSRGPTELSASPDPTWDYRHLSSLLH